MGVLNKLRLDPIEVVVVLPGRLAGKVAQVNELNADLALEIHFNACGGCGASGCETLYYPGSKEGLKAANIFQRRLVEAMGNRDRGVKEGWYKMDRPGVIDFYGDEDGDEMPDYFLRATNCPALILEPEFIEHHEVIGEVRDKAVKAIGKAILEYLHGWK